MPRGNPSPKLAITIEPDVHKNVLAAAARDRVSVSACDAAVLVVADGNDRRAWAEHKVRLELGLVPLVPAPVVAGASSLGEPDPPSALQIPAREPIECIRFE